MQKVAGILVLAALAACNSAPPYSNGDGVGFGDYDRYRETQVRRQAQYTGVSPIPPAGAIAPERATQVSLPQPVREDTAASIGAEAVAAIRPPAPSAATQPPVQTAAVAPNRSNPRISDEQDFDAVSSRETIQSDAERLEERRQQYQVVQPRALPTRSGNRPKRYGPYCAASGCLQR